MAVVALAASLWIVPRLAQADEAACVQVFPNGSVDVSSPCETGSVAGVRVCGTAGGAPPSPTTITPTTIHVTVTVDGNTVWVDAEGDATTQRGHAAAGVNGTHAGVADDDGPSDCP